MKVLPGITEADADAGALSETEVALDGAVGAADADSIVANVEETADPFDGVVGIPEIVDK